MREASEGHAFECLIDWTADHAPCEPINPGATPRRYLGIHWVYWLQHVGCRPHASNAI